MKTYLRLLITFLLTALLAACSILGINDVPSFTATQGSPDNLLAKANQTSNKEVANQYRLIAADKYLQLNQLEQATNTLNTIQPALTKQQALLSQMINADIALHKKDSATVLNIFSKSMFYRLDEQEPSLQVRIRLLKASAFEMEGKNLQALRERSYISPFLSASKAQDNQDNIWRLAMSTPLDVLQTAADSGETGGWIQLAKAVKGASTLKEQQDNITKWLSENPTHPAAVNPPSELLAIQNLSIDTYTKIGILLPQKEKYAQAVYNGFIAAYYKDKDKITIKSYESTDYSSMDAFYQQAKKDGIQLVIGPIEKDLVNELAQKPQLPITTLALNYADKHNFPPQLFQFGLLPEDEAREAASRAIADGHHLAIALVPQSKWGKKVLAAFRAQWEQQGGTIEGIQYIDRPVDLDRQIAELINKIPKGKKTTANDESMMFMVANPAIARQIKALLLYHDADQLPVYATSHIYTGIPNASQDNDLNGVLFTETPWLLTNTNPLQQDIIAQWPQAKMGFARLYALGVDTWHLIPRLTELKTLSNGRIEGLSGELSIDAEQRVNRKLMWATFKNGLIAPVSQ